MESRRLIVFDVAAEGVTPFEVRRDEAGTPRGWANPTVRWDGAMAAAAARAVDLAAGEPGRDTVILVNTSPDGSPAGEAMDRLQAALPEAAAFAETGARVDELLREAIADDPLVQSYDLIVAKRHPVTGRLRLGGHPLFGLESRRGAVAEVAIRCEPSDEDGVMFAVAAWQDRRPRLLSVHAARLPPGRHTVVAQLIRPGRVEFSEPPGMVRSDRTWEELVDAVPPRLDHPPAGPVHLVCAVEVDGPGEQVHERIGRVGQLVSAIADDLADALRVSLIAYGSHAYQRGAVDEPLHVPSWQVSAKRAHEALRRLEDRHPEHDAAAVHGYFYAAPVEDVLEEVTRRLGAGDGGRALLLTVGARPPHPPRADLSEILPCPGRYDWERLLSRLETLPGLTFGAICDHPPREAHPVWRRLGKDALAHLEAVDVRTFSTALGLAAPSRRRIPFPFLAAP
ncbi:hypothetical protein [Sphaerisporangium sp. TRM90804]|uniref:hypothetical protein n=1 Tax=Sphaerisporangium sp. TRM90804 TaxID=3031113 RepID=UPI002446D809|nr:hypothetical protein [Sphaerisporangium sp. TRM90804]MDH2427420.1 hypothetical protein [Sphaerisporangium sp. TRM90804]